VRQPSFGNHEQLPIDKFSSTEEATRYLASTLKGWGIHAEAMQLGGDTYKDANWNLILGKNLDTRLKVTYDTDTGLLSAGSAIFTNAWRNTESDALNPQGKYYKPAELASLFIGQAASVSVESSDPSNFTTFHDAFSALTDVLPHLGVATNVSTMPQKVRRYFENSLVQFFPNNLSSRNLEATSKAFGMQTGYIPVNDSSIGGEYVPMSGRPVNPELLNKIRDPWSGAQFSTHMGQYLASVPEMGMEYDSESGSLTGYNNKDQSSKINKVFKRSKRETWELDPLEYPNFGTQESVEQVLNVGIIQNAKYGMGEGKGVGGRLLGKEATTPYQIKNIPIDPALNIKDLQISERFRDIGPSEAVRVGSEGETIASIGDTKLGVSGTSFAGTMVGRMYLGVGVGETTVNQLVNALGSPYRSQIERNFSSYKPHSETERNQILGMVNNLVAGQDITAVFGEGKQDGLSLVYKQARVASLLSLKDPSQKVLTGYEEGLSESLKKDSVDYALSFGDIKDSHAFKYDVVRGFEKFLVKNAHNDDYVLNRDGRDGEMRSVAQKIADSTRSWKSEGIDGERLLEKQWQIIQDNPITGIDPDTGNKYPILPVLSEGAVVEYPGKGRIGFDTLAWANEVNPGTRDWIINKYGGNNPLARFALAAMGSKGKDIQPSESSLFPSEFLPDDEKLKMVSGYLSDQVKPGELISVGGVSLPHPDDIMSNGTGNARSAMIRLFSGYSDDTYINKESGIVSQTPMMGYEPYPIQDQIKDRAQAVRDEVELQLSGGFGRSKDSRTDTMALNTPGGTSEKMFASENVKGWTFEYGPDAAERMANGLGVSSAKMKKMGPLPYMFARSPEAQAPLYGYAEYNPDIKGIRMSTASGINFKGDWDADTVRSTPMFDVGEDGKIQPATGFEELLKQQGSPDDLALRTLSTFGSEKEFQSKYDEIAAAKGSSPTSHDMVYGYGDVAGFTPNLMGTKQNVVWSALESVNKVSSMDSLKALGNPDLKNYTVSRDKLVEMGLDARQNKHDMGVLTPLRELRMAMSTPEQMKAVDEAFPQYGQTLRSMMKGQGSTMGDRLLTPSSQILDKTLGIYQIPLDGGKLPFRGMMDGGNYAWTNKMAGNGRRAGTTVGGLAGQDFDEIVKSGYGSPEEIAMMFSPADAESLQKVSGYVSSYRNGSVKTIPSGIHNIVTSNNTPYSNMIRHRVSNDIRNRIEAGTITQSEDGTGWELKNGGKLSNELVKQALETSEDSESLRGRVSRSKHGDASSFLDALRQDEVYGGVLDVVAKSANTTVPDSPVYGKNLHRSLSVPRTASNTNGEAAEPEFGPPPMPEENEATRDTPTQIAGGGDNLPPIPPSVVTSADPLPEKPKRSKKSKKGIAPSRQLAQPSISPQEPSSPVASFDGLGNPSSTFAIDGNEALSASESSLSILRDIRSAVSKPPAFNVGRVGARYNQNSIGAENDIVQNYIGEDGTLQMPFQEAMASVNGSQSLHPDTKVVLSMMEMAEQGLLSKPDLVRLSKGIGYQATKEHSRIPSLNGQDDELGMNARYRAFSERLNNQIIPDAIHPKDTPNHPATKLFEDEIAAASKALNEFKQVIASSTEGSKEQAEAIKKLTPGLSTIAARLSDTTGIKGVSKELPESVQKAQILEEEARRTHLPQSQGGLIPDSTWNLMSEQDQRQLSRSSRNGSGGGPNFNSARTGEKLLGALFAMQTVRSLRYTFDPMIQGANQYATSEADALGSYNMAFGQASSIYTQNAVLNANRTISNLKYGIGQNAYEVIGGFGNVLNQSGISTGGPLGYLSSIVTPAFGAGAAAALGIGSAAGPIAGLVAGGVTFAGTAIAGMALYNEGASKDSNAKMRYEILASQGLTQQQIAQTDSSAYTSKFGKYGANPLLASVSGGQVREQSDYDADIARIEMADQERIAQGLAPLAPEIKKRLAPKSGQPIDTTSQEGKNVISRLQTSPFDWSGLSTLEVSGMIEAAGISNTPLNNVFTKAGLTDPTKQKNIAVQTQVIGARMNTTDKEQLMGVLAQADVSSISGGIEYQLGIATKLAQARGDGRWDAGANILKGGLLNQASAMGEIDAMNLVGGPVGLNQLSGMLGIPANFGNFQNLSPQAQIGLQMFQKASPEMLSRMYAKTGMTIPGIGVAGTYTMDSFNNRGLFDVSAWGTPGLDMQATTTSYDVRGVPYTQPSNAVGAIQSAWGLSASAAKAFSGQTYSGVGGETGLRWYMRDYQYSTQMQQMDLEAASASAQHAFSVNVSRPIAVANYQMNQASLWGGSVDTKWGTYDAGAGKFAWERQQMDISLADMQAGYVQQQARIGWSYQDLSRQQYQNSVRAGWQRQDFSLHGQQIGLSRQMQAYDFNYQQTSLSLHKDWMEQDYSYNQQMRGMQFGWAMEDYDIAIRRSTGFERRQLIKRKNREEQTFSLEGGQLEKQHNRQEQEYKLQEEHMKVQRQYQLEINKIEDQNFANSKKRFEEENKWREEQFGIEKSRLGEQAGWAAQAHDRQMASFKIRREQLEAEESSAKVQAKMEKERMDAQFKLEDQLYGIQMAKMALARQEATEIFNTQKAIDRMNESARQAQAQLPKMMDDIAYTFVEDMIQYLNKMLGPLGLPVIPGINRNSSQSGGSPGVNAGVQSVGQPKQQVVRRYAPQTIDDGSSPQTQTIFVQLDTSTLLKAVVKGMPREVKVKERAQYVGR